MICLKMAAAIRAQNRQPDIPKRAENRGLSCKRAAIFREPPALIELKSAAI